MELMLDAAKLWKDDSTTTLSASSTEVTPVDKLINFFGLDFPELEKKEKARQEKEDLITDLVKQIADLKAQAGTSTPDPDDPAYAFYMATRQKIFELETQWTILTTEPTENEKKDFDYFLKNLLNVLTSHQEYVDQKNRMFQMFAGTTYWSGELKDVKMNRYGIFKDDLMFEFLGTGKKWCPTDEEYDDGTTVFKESVSDVQFPFVVYYPILKFRLVLLLEIIE
jgi:hypothetical protein